MFSRGEHSNAPCRIAKTRVKIWSMGQWLKFELVKWPRYDFIGW